MWLQRGARGEQEQKAGTGDAESDPLKRVQTEGSLEAGLPQKAEPVLEQAGGNCGQARRLTCAGGVSQPKVRRRGQNQGQCARKQRYRIERLRRALVHGKAGVRALGKVAQGQK